MQVLLAAARWPVLHGWHEGGQGNIDLGGQVMPGGMNGGMPNIDQGGQAIAGGLNGGVPNMNQGGQAMPGGMAGAGGAITVVYPLQCLKRAAFVPYTVMGTMHVPVDWKLLSMVDGPRCAMISGIVADADVACRQLGYSGAKQPLSELWGPRAGRSR